MQLKFNNFPWRVSAIEQESELLIDPKSLTMPLTRIERENKEVRIPQGDSKPKRERQRTFSSRALYREIPVTRKVHRLSRKGVPEQPCGRQVTKARGSTLAQE